MFYQDGPIDNFTHVLVPVAKLSSDSDYNAGYTAGISISHFRILKN